MSRKVDAAKQANPAAVYNEKRRIIFSGYHRNPIEAKGWLESYRKVLGPAGYVGLKAELKFFERYRREYGLVPALDVGDATDFTGVIGGVMHRIDVTTNASFKNLKAYEPMQAEGDRYQIAVYDAGQFELVDVNFPFCSECGTGRVLPTAMLLGENVNRQGESAWSNDQVLVAICNACGFYEVVDRVTTPFLYDFDYWYDTLNESNVEAAESGAPPVEVERELLDHALSAMRYLRESFGQYLVAIGGKHYEVTNPRDADGHWTYRLVHVAPLVRDHLQDAYPWDIEPSCE